MAGNNSLELEVHTLFQSGYTLENICREILSKYEKSDVISPSEAEALSHFLITSGKIDTLFKFYRKCLQRKSISIFPWGHLAEAALQVDPVLSDLLIDIIEMGLEAQPEEESCLRSARLVEQIPTLSVRIQLSKKNYALERLELKTKLMAQLNHNRLYQLAEQEEQTLQQLIKIFPRDIEVKLLHQAHLEKKADEILSRIKSPHSTSSTNPRRSLADTNPETQRFIQNLSVHLLILAKRLQTESPEQIYNLAMLAMQFELFDLSLELVNLAPVTFASEWLKAEILFESGRYLDLLKHIEMIEQIPTNTAESTYGAVYLKAQAYFGLGQKEIAVRLLESLSEKVPNYRSTQALLHEWKTS